METIKFTDVTDNGETNRYITVTNGFDTWQMPFASTKVKDSEALHVILCYVNPGEEFTVTFSSVPSFKCSIR